MLRKKEKAQGLVEFALILPLLLLLLLGIIEAARILWAYITVQTAAREAARYAIAGRPYINADVELDDQYDVCIRNLSGTAQEPEPYVSGAQPWACDPLNRLQAIENIALERGRTLALSDECTGSGGEVDFTNPASCANKPGAFSVFVRGQVTTQTVEGTTVVTLVTNHPGTQGLNVEISTFYNVQMLDPIFDALMGGNYIQMQGRVVLQNEGIDAAIGIIPPPAIDTPVPGDEIDAGTPTANYQITSNNGYQVEQTGSLDVQLENHAPISGGYDIYLSNPSLGTYKICTIQTDVSNRGNMSCSLASFSIPEGTYDFYSTAAGVTDPRLGISLTPVEVIVSSNPTILVNNGYTWAAGSQTTLSLVAHPTEEQIRVQLYDPSGSLVQTITASTSPTSTNIIWSVPDVVGSGNQVCDFKSGNPCTIRSFQATSGTPVAQVNVFVNQPTIVLAAGDISYAQGETVLIYLRGHTPNQVYDLYIKGGSPDPLFLGQTLLTNSAGDTTYPIYWDIPLDCDTDVGWSNGVFPIVSRPAGQSTELAQKDIEVDTPTDPYLTIDGGYTWPSGSFITINLFKHNAGVSHYLNFGSDRVLNTSGDDTFLTNGCGNYLAEYTIPVTTAQGVYPVRSFLTAGDALQASRNVTVNAEPYILVKEGNRVLPNMTITIQLGNHAPNTGYRVIYDGYEMFQVQTDATGVAEQQYDLINLPAALRDTSVFGILRDLHSEATTNLGVAVASTTLALQGADLAITNVQFPANAGSQGLNVSVPVTLTIKNLSPVSITSYFDTDFYFNPSPIAPSPLAGYNFPGDAKHWRDSVGPAGQSSDTFIMTDTFVLQKYGMQTVYGFTDNRNLIYEGEAAGYAANPNNLGSTVFTVTCTAPPLTDTFASGLGAWSTERYGSSNTGSGGTISGQELYLENDGTSTFQSDDNWGGYLYFYRTNPVTATAGLDIIVKVNQAPSNTSWSKAGIEVRNSLSSNSSRVFLGLGWYTPLNPDQHILQPGYRDGGGTNWAAAEATMASNYHFTISSANPVWLRLQRVAGSNTFNYYAKQQPTQPTNWGTAAASVTMSTIGDKLYVGLFNSSYVDGANGTARFDDFSLAPNPTACQDNPAPDQEIPPGLEICTPVLQDRSFEQGSPSWQYLTGEGVSRSTNAAHTGLFSLRGTTFNGIDFNPVFYQQFTMPNWVTNTTVFTLDLYVNIDNRGDDQTQDQFYAVVATTPSTSTRITTPTLVANGDMPGSAWNKNTWTHLPLALPISIDPATLESYANQSLYLILYNTSNSSGGACGGSGCTTWFYFDDVNLLSCTSQPKPDNINTRLTGNLTLHFADGTTSKPAYTKVWAYTPGDDTLYETFTLLNGEYNFYNLPASTAGKTYYLFTEYDVVDPDDSCQIETLSASASVKLFTTNDDDFPAKADMHLYTLPIIDHCP